MLTNAFWEFRQGCVGALGICAGVFLSGCRRAVQNAVGTVTVFFKGGGRLVPMMMGTVVFPSGDSRVVPMAVGTSTVFLRGDGRGAWMVMGILRPQVGQTMDPTANARFPNVSFPGIVSAGVT